MELKSQYIWGVVWILYMVPIVFPLGMPVIVRPSTQEAWDYTENLPEGSIVVQGGEGIYGFDMESAPAQIAWIRHCYRKGYRLVNIPLSVESWSVNWKCVEWAGVLEEHGGTWKYGVDFVQLPYIPGRDAAFVSLMEDVWETAKTDSFGTPLSEIPLMQEFRTGDDIAMWSVPHWNIYQVVKFGTADYGFAALHCAQAGAYINTLQYAAMYPGKVFVTNGLQGGAEYEKLEGFKAIGTASIDGYGLYSIAFVIFFILGNYQMLRTQGGEE